MDVVQLDHARSTDADVLALLRSWEHEPLAATFQRLGQRAAALAERLGRAPVDVAIVGGRLRLDQRRYGALFSSWVHLVRNAVDHGLETPDERAAAGKRRTARLPFGAELTPTHLELWLEDDGRGVDWEAIAAKALALGSPRRHPPTSPARSSPTRILP